ncbi:MAG: alpha/beta hydrolase [Gemmataceae bacterium]
MKARPWLRRLLRLGTLAVVLWLGASSFIAYKLTHRHRARYEEPTPAVSWGTLAPLRLVATDGAECGAWFLDGQVEKPPVVLLHGNGADRSQCLPQAAIAARRGHPVLLLTVRAHGDSTGEVNDIGYSARQDLIAAVNWLHHRKPNRRVVLWGQSLGSAVAAFAAADLGDRAGGYILESPYRDLRTAVRNRTEMALPAVLNEVAYYGLATVAPLFVGDVDRIAPVDAVAAIPSAVPVLIVAGSADQHARPFEARAIHERLGPRSRLVMIDGAPHGGLTQADPAGYEAAVTELLGRALP